MAPRDSYIEPKTAHVPILCDPTNSLEKNYTKNNLKETYSHTQDFIHKVKIQNQQENDFITEGTYINLMKNCTVHKINKFEDYEVVQYKYHVKKQSIKHIEYQQKGIGLEKNRAK